MWCIQEITPEYRKRMYRLLDLYGKGYDAVHPVVCMDEKSKLRWPNFHGQRIPINL